MSHSGRDAGGGSAHTVCDLSARTTGDGSARFMSALIDDMAAIAAVRAGYSNGGKTR
jgi:hypothetical protein